MSFNKPPSGRGGPLARLRERQPLWPLSHSSPPAPPQLRPWELSEPHLCPREGPGWREGFLDRSRPPTWHRAGKACSLAGRLLGMVAESRRGCRENASAKSPFSSFSEVRKALERSGRERGSVVLTWAGESLSLPRPRWVRLQRRNREHGRGSPAASTKG